MNLKQYFSRIACEIRKKTGNADYIPLSEFDEAIMQMNLGWTPSENVSTTTYTVAAGNSVLAGDLVALSGGYLVSEGDYIGIAAENGGAGATISVYTSYGGGSA